MDHLACFSQHSSDYATHYAFLRLSLEPGQQALEGVNPSSWERVVERTEHVATVTAVQYPRERVAMMLDLLRRSGEILGGAPALTEYLVTSVYLCLTWDRTLIAVDPNLAGTYACRALAEPGDFASLFALPNQTYYLILGGEMGGKRYDAVLLTRSAHPVEGLYLNLSLLAMNDENGLTPIAALSMPCAGNWDEAAALLAVRDAAMLKGVVSDHELALYLSPMREIIAQWEPLAALLHAVLVGRDGRAYGRAAAAAPRSDVGLATLYASAGPDGRVRYGELPTHPQSSTLSAIPHPTQRSLQMPSRRNT